MERIARCGCGQLTATCVGEPMRVSVCHCRMCQIRTGAAFSAQARFPLAAVTLAGEARVWNKVADDGRRASFSWCPECGGTVAFANEGRDDIAIPLGAFAGGDVPAPGLSIYEESKQPWVEIVGSGIVHDR